MVDLRRQFSFVRSSLSLSRRISSSKGREKKTVDEKREKGGVMLVVSILILHILLKQINNYHSFVLSTHTLNVRHVMIIDEDTFISFALSH